MPGSWSHAVMRIIAAYCRIRMPSVQGSLYLDANESTTS